ncbi:pep-cterm sorting domain-containing protein [Anaeramoeba ignava]|uniref:Pep-cterm sorting domain-containing protein n=1 Tax=Anaeramoeba ignava TaxID=1746090 RepID=A0A9Q0LD99_ANAIG|nr:pep-cterm sorting domain-containing protein [Anaeramoeba ignava]
MSRSKFSFKENKEKEKEKKKENEKEKKEKTNKKNIKKQLIKDLNKLYEQRNQNYDFILKIGKKLVPFPVNKSILISRSDFFHNLLRSEPISEYTIPNIKPEVMEPILKYIYTSQTFDPKPDLFFDCLFWSNFFNLDLLTEYLITKSQEIDEKIAFKFFILTTKTPKTIENLCLSSNIKKNILDDHDFFSNLNQERFLKLIQYVTDDWQRIDLKIFQTIDYWIQSQLKKNGFGLSSENYKKKSQFIANKILSKIKISRIDEEVGNKILDFPFINEEFLERLELNSKILSGKETQNPQELKQLMALKKFQNSSIIKEKLHSEKLLEWVDDKEFSSKMNLGYSANRNNFSVKKFHKICDNKNQTLVIIKTQDRILGGFTSKGFISGISGWQEHDRKAFIFLLENKSKKYHEPRKFPIKEDQIGRAIKYDKDKGPIFGDDLKINEEFKGRSDKFGKTYSPRSENRNELKTYLTGFDKYWEIDELEVYFC